MDESRYTLTIYVAAPGTPLNLDGGTSLPGHMYYSTAQNGQRTGSYGFAPIEHGQMNAKGKIFETDVDNYSNPLFSRTLEISKGQYDTLRSFGEDPTRYGFSLDYQDVRNNCVDFTWAAIDQAGLKHGMSLSLPTIGSMGPDIRIPLPGHVEGKSALRPARNILDVQSIEAPKPDSGLNSEHRNPMPTRTPTQWLLSDTLMNDTGHPGHGMYRQALDGVHALNRDHDVAPSPRDDDFASAIAVNARREGLDQIDHVILSDDASRTFAVQGPLQGSNGADRQIASMDTMQALQTPLAQSSEAWAQADGQAAELAQAQAKLQNQATTIQQQGQVMSLS